MKELLIGTLLAGGILIPLLSFFKDAVRDGVLAALEERGLEGGHSPELFSTSFEFRNAVRDAVIEALDARGLGEPPGPGRRA